MCDFGNVFAYICRTSGDTVKQMVPFDSAHQIGLTMPLKEVLTVDEGVCECGFKMCYFGNVFAHVPRTNWDTVKSMAPFHSAHQIGLTMLLKKVLTVDEWVCWCDFKMCNFGNISANVHRTSRDTGKRMALFDLGHQIDLKYTLERGDSIQYLSIWLSCKYLTFSLRTYSGQIWNCIPQICPPCVARGFA